MPIDQILDSPTPAIALREAQSAIAPENRPELYQEYMKALYSQNKS